MARKRYSDEDILKLLREIELNLNGADVSRFMINYTNTLSIQGHTD